MDNSENANVPSPHARSDQTKSVRVTALLGVYQEICKSHQAIDEFRMKLLGLLPLASLTGIFLVSKSDSVFGPPDSTVPNKLIAFIAIFAATFTVALFLYEIRGILMCTELIYRGCKIESDLEVTGQFSARRDGHNKWRFLNAITAACFIYSVVFAAWLFLALHRGFGFNIKYCTFAALTTGILLTTVMVYLVNSFVDRIHKVEITSLVAARAVVEAPTIASGPQTTSLPTAGE